MKIHLTVPVTRLQGSWPAYGSFETACGRQILGEVTSTDRRQRVTCLTCRRVFRRATVNGQSFKAAAARNAKAFASTKSKDGQYPI